MNVKAKKVITWLIVILILVTAGTSGYIYYQVGKIKHIKISKTNKDLGIKSSIAANVVQSSDRVINIALFGIDSGRHKYDAQNSDCIMILSIDEVHKKIKLSSVMRDSYVEIDGHGKDKINYAYASGGPQLAIKTINQNFDLDIRDFVTVDFFGLEKIVNDLGGVDVNVKQSEINEVNKFINEVAGLENEKATPVTRSGMQILNGLQATAYARIRYVGDGDFERTERQKTVLTALISKIEDQGTVKYPSILAGLFPYIQTSMTNSEILSLSAEVVSKGITETDWYRFPLDGYCNQAVIKGGWYLTIDLDATKEQIHKFIYDDEKVAPKKPLF